MFNDKVVIITGGGSGIGEALCKNIASQGAIVYVAGINQEQVDEVTSAIQQTGGNAKSACLDVGDIEEYRSFVEEVWEAEKRIDYLFNNAAITLISELKDTPLDRCQEVLNTNLFGVLNGIHLVYPLMASQGHGYITNTASLAGVLGYPTSAIYAASKAAVLSLSNSLRFEAKAFGIQVSAVCPGYVDTGIFKQERIIGASLESIINGIPFKMISPEKAAQEIIKGMKKNKSVITFPFYARATSLIGSLCPALLNGKYREVLDSFRKDNVSPKN